MSAKSIPISPVLLQPADPVHLKKYGGAVFRRNIQSSTQKRNTNLTFQLKKAHMHKAFATILFES